MNKPYLENCARGAISAALASAYLGGPVGILRGAAVYAISTIGFTYNSKSTLSFKEKALNFEDKILNSKINVTFAKYITRLALEAIVTLGLTLALTKATLFTAVPFVATAFVIDAGLQLGKLAYHLYQDEEFRNTFIALVQTKMNRTNHAH